MAGEAQDSIWPLPKFYFLVDFGGELSGELVPFQEVTGLETETQAIEYHSGNSAIFAPIKMPGLAKVCYVTMKKGIFSADGGLWDWYKAFIRNSIQPRNATISLLDQDGRAQAVWTLYNAFPVKVVGKDLKAEGAEVAVEAIEVACEGMTFSNKG